jgi:putative flavoprotein involved in K+ transport
MTLDVKNVIWCTGYHHGFPWIDLAIFDGHGDPIHERGIVDRVPGMYFVGLHFLYSITSATLMGVGRDAERVARAIAIRPSLSLEEGEGWLRSIQPGDLAETVQWMGEKVG